MTDPLLAMLRAHSFRRGTFTLTSGRESDFFIDCKPTVLRAAGHRHVGRALLRALREEPLAAVAGVELGGCSLASAAALYSLEDGGAPLDAVYVRKAAKGHGTQKQLEGADHLATGARLAVVEDTVTTGGSTVRALEVLRAAGFEVPLVVAVVDRLEGARATIEAAGVRFVSLYTRHDFIPPGEGTA